MRKKFESEILLKPEETLSLKRRDNILSKNTIIKILNCIEYWSQMLMLFQYIKIKSKY